MDTRVLISNIQRFCLHDGPGIRTTVFCKGCNLHCPWCANPENIDPKMEKYFEGQGTFELMGVYGEWMTLKNIYDEVIKDKIFYKEGGVTFSGGEPLLVISKLEPLLKLLQQKEIDICAETALFVPESELLIALNYLNTLIIDIKILDAKKSETVHGGRLKTYMRNVEIVNSANIDVIYRIPLIKPYTTEEANIDRIIDFLQNKKYLSVELIKGHNLAEKKYQSMNKTRYIVPNLSDEEIHVIHDKFKRNGIKAEICKI